jgi:tetratricopeptide (TPR) repeat protein
VDSILIGLLGALLATNQPAAISNLVTQTTGLTVNVPDTNDPVEKEFRQIMMDDDAVLNEVDSWISENNDFAEKGGGQPAESFNTRIHAKFAGTIKAYEGFIQRHPDHVGARIAYGSFLNDIKDEEGAEVQYKKAVELDPKNPAAWNQLGLLYGEGHLGEVKKAIECLEKAIDLNPNESVYYRNLGDIVGLFRKDAMEYYKIDEQQVFNKTLGLYQHARKLDPDDFELAQNLAETYYSIKPFRADEGLAAWTNALNVAENELEREGVYVHLARFKLHAERFAEARQQLTGVTNETFYTLKMRLLHNIDDQEAKAQQQTNASSPSVELKSADPGKSAAPKP